MIQIDMPMPDNCDECRFNTEYGFCKAMPDNFCGNTDDRKRPEWCPMKKQEKLVDVDALREKLGLANDCDKCKQNSRACQYDSHFSLMDFCERFDMAIEELM
jgi:hypothetical protein